MYDITAQQTRHFSQFGWIEFEEFLSPEECTKIFSHLQQIALKRLHIQSFSMASSDRLYEATRDCWREEPWLKKLFLSRHFLEAAKDLSGKQSLTFVCDQWIPAAKSFDPLNLSAHFSFQNLICAALLSLEGDSIGRVRWINPERLPLFGTSELLVIYGSLNTVYIQNPKDPSNSFLKQFGYNFGDRVIPR
jgi:hypothetical protein